MRRFAEVVHRHGGQVLRFMDDGLKAAFGLPEPADDDALRAVRAAQAVLAEAQTHAEAMLEAVADPEPGDATERPAQWLAVADARRASGDAVRAALALGAAFEELPSQAARIGDPVVRERFLTEVPANRRIRQEAAGARRGRAPLRWGCC